MDPYFPSYTKLNSRWIKSLYVKKQNYNLLEKNVSEYIYDFSVGKYFFQMNTKSSTHKEERLINLPSVNSQKTFIQPKTHYTKWKKTLHTGRI